MGGAIGGLPETPALSDDSGANTTGAKTGEGGSIGAYLKRQRKLRGLSLADLESATRVPKRSLERLEAGAYDGIPDGFARGFVRTVAGAIGLDPEQTVARMLAEPEWVGDGRRPVWMTGLWVASGALVVASLVLVMVGGIRATKSAAPIPNETAVLRRFDAVRALAAELGMEPGTNGAVREQGLAHEAPALADDPREIPGAVPIQPGLELPPLPPRAGTRTEEVEEPAPEGPHPAEMPSAAN